MRKFLMLKTVLLILLSIFVVPLKTNAATTIAHVYPDCDNDGYKVGTPYSNKYYGINQSCDKDMSEKSGDGGGIYACIQKAMNLWTNPVYTEPGQTTSRIESHVVILQRIDAWATSIGEWNSITNFRNKDNTGNIDICPEMYLNYTSSFYLKELHNGISYNAYNGLKNVKIKNIKILDLNKDTYPTKELSDESYYTLQNYSVKDVKITDWSGNDINNLISINIDIPKLETYGGPYGLGYNGTNGFLGKGNARALHYLVPIDITIEYDNTEQVNPCLYGTSTQSPQEYAYENPGVCCVEYPETCCNNPEWIDKIKDFRKDVLDFCCIDTEKYISFGNSASNNLNNIPTFYKYYRKNEFDTAQKELVDNLCEDPNNKDSCTKPDDYYTFIDSSGNIAQSDCCKTGKYKNDYKEKCNSKDTNNDLCQYEHEYKYDNYCCNNGKYKDKYKEICTNSSTPNKKNELTCKNNPTNIQNVVANGNNSSNGNSISENIKFTSYDTLDIVQNNVIEAGTGFKYNIGVSHNVELLAKQTYVTNANNASDATDEAKKEIDKFFNNNTEDNIKSKLQSVSKSFIFTVDGGKEEEDNYVPTEINFSSKSDNCQIQAWYESTDMEGNSNLSSSVFEYNCKKTYTYTYNIELQQKYISKENAEIETNVSQNDKYKYLDGSNKFYTKTTTTSGKYGFTVKVKDNTNSVTGILTNKEFNCEYTVKNRIKDSNNKKYYFRPISLYDPFPNGRVIGSNWQGTSKSGESKVSEYITDNGDSVYGDDPMYEVTLDSDLINQIKKYNKSVDYDYSWINMSDSIYDKLDSTSNFLSGIGSNSINWNGKLSINITETKRRSKVGDFE